MENDMSGFIYVGQASHYNVSKIGFTRRRDPDAYVIERFGGLLEIKNLMPVSHARHAEKVVHFAFRRYRIEFIRSRELFLDLPHPEEVQAILSWALRLGLRPTAQLVDHPERLRAYICQYNIRLLLNAKATGNGAEATS